MDKELYNFLTSMDKPFFVDTIRKLLQRFDKDEISLNKFVEDLNITAYDWRRLPKEKQPNRVTSLKVSYNESTDGFVITRSNDYAETSENISKEKFDKLCQYAENLLHEYESNLC